MAIIPVEDTVDFQNCSYTIYDHADLGKPTMFLQQVKRICGCSIS